MCCIKDVVLSHTALWNRCVPSSPALRPCTILAQWYVCLGILCLACWAPCLLHGAIACVCFCCLHLACGTCRWDAALDVARGFWLRLSPAHHPLWCPLGGTAHRGMCASGRYGAAWLTRAIVARTYPSLTADGSPRICDAYGANVCVCVC